MNWGPVIKVRIDFLLRSSLQLETKAGKERDKQSGQGICKGVAVPCAVPKEGPCLCPIHLEFEN